MSSAAIIIIGNEILTGKFADENAPWLIGRLRSLGVDLGRIVTIPDTIEDIAHEVRTASARFDHVFTSGGVGPTHDDLTLPGVAAALGVPVVRHPELEGILRTRMGAACNEAALRMADLPEGAELWWEGQVRWPLVVARNVVIFPGVPALLRAKFDGVAHRFAGVPVQTVRLVTTATEPEIADLLTAASRRWEGVAIGSYPRFETSPRTVIVTMESRDGAALAECERWLREHVPAQVGG